MKGNDKISGLGSNDAGVFLPGQGCLFLLCPTMVEVNRRFKMGYSDAVYDSEAWPAITHFKAAGKHLC